MRKEKGGNCGVLLPGRLNSGVCPHNETLEAFVILTLVGKSLEVIPLGTTHLRIGNDQFEWCRFSFRSAVQLLKVNVQEETLLFRKKPHDGLKVFGALREVDYHQHDNQGAMHARL
jgi:hypothetical protein